MVQSRRNLPPLNALRAFEVSGRKLSFRAASEELGVTQGAVAQHVRALEEHLGLLLFIRLSRGLSLTAAGAIYLTEVGRAFDALALGTSKLRKRNDVVTVSVTPTIAAKVLIPRLGELRDSLPLIELRTVATESLADFDRDQVDIAVRLSRLPLRSDLEAQVLFRQETIAVANPHLLKGKALPLSLKQLQALPLLHDALDLWPAFLEEQKELPGTTFNQTTLALDAALAGQGVALSCRAFVAADLRAGRLLQISDKTMLVEPNYLLVRKRGASHSPAALAVWNWFAESLSIH